MRPVLGEVNQRLLNLPVKPIFFPSVAYAMEDGYTNYTIRMKEQKRDEWKEVVDDSDQFGSVSQLVRFAVDQQIGRMGEDEMSKEEKEIMDKMESENSRLRSQLDDVQSILENIQESHLTQSEAEAIAHNHTQTLINEFHHGDQNE